PPFVKAMFLPSGDHHKSLVLLLCEPHPARTSAAMSLRRMGAWGIRRPDPAGESALKYLQRGQSAKSWTCMSGTERTNRLRSAGSLGCAEAQPSSAPHGLDTAGATRSPYLCISGSGIRRFLRRPCLTVGATRLRSAREPLRTSSLPSGGDRVRTVRCFAGLALRVRPPTTERD